MVRIRHGSLALALALAFVACKKDEKKSDPAGGDKTAEKGGTGGGGAAAGAAATSEDLSLLPLDSELVLGINFAQVQSSALWKQFVEPKLMTGDATKKLAEFKAKCGFDPMASVKTVSVGMKHLDGGKPDGVIVIHGLDKAKSLDCMEKNKDEFAKDGGSYAKDGDVVLFTGKDGEQAAMTFTNDSTAVVALGSQGNTAGIKQVAAGGSTLKSSPPFLEMYSKVKTGDSLWMLMNGNSKVFDKMGAIGVKPKAMFGSINVTDGLSLDLRLRLESPDAATQLTNMSKAQLGQAKQMFDQVDVVADGSDVKYTVVLSSVKLQELIAKVGGMFGALGGM